MKTSRTILTVIVSLLFISNTFAGIRNINFFEQPVQNGQPVSTILYNGVMIPVVELQEVEISDTKIQPKWLPASYINGRWTPLASLPEVEIVAASPGNNHFPSINYHGKSIAIAYLPVVEIAADYPAENSVGVVMVNGEPMAFVALDEVEINEHQFFTTNTDTRLIADSWAVSTPHNPELVVAQQNETYYLMSYEGSTSNENGKSYAIYRLLHIVRRALSGTIQTMFGP
ncbi:MAG TPA: hypothetical protein VFW78_11160 [Bacteroidia bacterium]|nr:hypothetical protein [Bacteroidia bacterium]